MLDADIEVCADCGNLHMEGDPGPDEVDECAVCGGHVNYVDASDLVGL